MENIKQALYHFYQDVGEKYPEEDEVYNTLRGQLRKKFILSRLKHFKGSLLEIGCNRGMYLQAYEGGSCFGVDLSLSVLKRAHKARPMHLAVADAENLACFQKQSFKNVLCSEVLEHCPNPQAVIDNIKHVLKPGGYALITTPNYKGEKSEWMALGILTSYGINIDNEEGYYHSAYHPEELRAFAEIAGLQIVESGTFEKEIKYVAGFPVLILHLGRLLSRLIRSQRFTYANERFYHKFSLGVYALLRATRLNSLLLRFVSTGARTFILLKKK